MQIKQLIMHPYFRLALIGSIVILLLNSCEYGPEHGTVAVSENPFIKQSHPLAVEAVEDFTENDLRIKGNRLSISSNGRCTMNCQKINCAEIQEIIDQENIDHSSSDDLVSSGECPKVVYEGATKDKRTIRVEIGNCDEDYKIISVSDLENKDDCDCL